MRIVSSNLLFGMSLADGRSDLDRVCASLGKLAPDVLAIQEVDRYQNRSGHCDQTVTIAERLGLVDYRFVPAIVGEPGGQWRSGTDNDSVSQPATLTQPKSAFGLASYGIGLLLREPALKWHVVRLAASRIVSPIVMPGTKKLIWLRDEPRVLVCAEVTPTLSSPFRTIATTHLSFVPGVNVRQLKSVRLALEQLPGPHLLVGDLNVPGPVARTALRRWTSLANMATYPINNPKIQFDHAFSSDKTVSAHCKSTIEALDFSDHCALVVDVDRRGDAQ
jgi:endonuclease/exonuclease/phosphatase family metal-dependent hydrolase